MIGTIIDFAYSIVVSVCAAHLIISNPAERPLFHLFELIIVMGIVWMYWTINITEER
jgi:hypothetical protein